MREHVQRIHFVGIGGAGMSGIAEVLVNQGYRVSGSDVVESTATRRLTGLGAEVHIGHDARWIEGCDVVVASSAVAVDNVEVAAAHAAKIPVIPRAEMLGELMRFGKGIAVAGTHGKTTTTSLVAQVLAAAGLDPTFVVGGRVRGAGSHARLGRGEYIVAEADESDASFLRLQPLIAVVTNIDADHMGTYGGDFERLKGAFVDFLHNLPFYGLAVLCADDPGLREILTHVHKPVLTYGLSADADVRGTDLRQDGLRMRFNVHRPAAAQPLAVELALAGRHNVENALAAVAVAHKLGLSDAPLAAALAEFQGIDRRFQVIGDMEADGGRALVVDDYAHHPRELQATLDAASGAWPERRLVTVFQPHRYTRTRDLLDDFSAVLAGRDPLVIAEVYAAGEAPIAGADGRALCRAIRARGLTDPVFVPRVAELPAALGALVKDGDVVLMLGAGDISRVAARLVGGADARHG